MSRLVLLVDLVWARPKDPPVSLAAASLIAAVRARTGAEVRSLTMTINSAEAAPGDFADRILEQTTGFSSDAVDVAIGVYVWAESFVRELIARLRASGFKGRIILGGPQVTYAGLGLESLYPGADAFVRGYGESALCELAEGRGRQRIPGVHYAGSPDLCEQACVDLSALPSPWLDGTVPLEGRSFIRWETQRGCPYACSFCQHREPGKRHRVRSFARERLLAEVDLFCRAGVEDVAVVDPVFHAGDHARPVLRGFSERRYRGRLSVQCRAECMDQGFLTDAAKLNVRLEFGLQTIHPNEATAVRRANDLTKLERTLAEARRAGLCCEVSLIYGLPDQTLESFTRSVEWCLDRRFSVVKAFPLMLLRGTSLAAERGRWRLVEDDSEIPTVTQTATCSAPELRAMAGIAAALQETEGHHPRLGDLLALAEEKSSRRTSRQMDAA